MKHTKTIKIARALALLNAVAFMYIAYLSNSLLGTISFAVFSIGWLIISYKLKNIDDDLT